MATSDFTITLSVDRTPNEAFNAINNVRGWWTEDMEGSAQKLNDEFSVRFFDDIHVSTQKLVEVIPNKKVVWLVTKSALKFLEDQNEWTGTKISFEIAEKDGKSDGNRTQIRFTHIGLVPEVECYKDCTVGWSRYITGSLLHLLAEGKGKPELKLNNQNIEKMTTKDFTTTILVDKTSKEAFNAINNVRGWWSEEIEGSTDKLNDEFKYHFEDIHRCRIKLIELIPDKKVVWLVVENYFKPGIFDDASHTLRKNDGFSNDKAEWTDTKICFEISAKDNQTLIRFIHLGLVPEYQCFDACSNGWSHYIGQSLFSLITTGKGEPNSTGSPMTADEVKLHAAAN